jgi:ribosomal protein S15P/S13E
VEESLAFHLENYKKDKINKNSPSLKVAKFSKKILTD